jgi:hypothetical protein
MSNEKAEDNEPIPRASNLERKPPRLVLRVDPADPARNVQRGKHYHQGGKSYDRRLIDAYLELTAALPAASLRNFLFILSDAVLERSEIGCFGGRYGGINPVGDEVVYLRKFLSRVTRVCGGAYRLSLRMSASGAKSHKRVANRCVTVALTQQPLERPEV